MAIFWFKSQFTEESVHGRWRSTLSCKCQRFRATLFVDCGQFCMLWTSSAFRRIINGFNDSRRPEALSLLGDADDGSSRHGCRPTIKCTIRTQFSALHSRFRPRHFDICNAPCRIPLPIILEIDSSGHSHGTTRRCIVSFVNAQLLTRLLVGRLNATLEYSTLEDICPIGCNIQ